MLKCQTFCKSTPCPVIIISYTLFNNKDGPRKSCIFISSIIKMSLPMAIRSCFTRAIITASIKFLRVVLRAKPQELQSPLHVPYTFLYDRKSSYNYVNTCVYRHAHTYTYILTHIIIRIYSTIPRRENFDFDSQVIAVDTCTRVHMYALETHTHTYTYERL